jgi:transposase-like protein
MIKHAMACCREPIHKQILGVYIPRHRNIIIAESFLSSLIKLCGKYIVIVIRKNMIWYPGACISLGLKHILHSLYEKSMV